MTRTWQDNPKVTLQTQYGPVEAVWTDAGHVSVHTDAHHNDDLPAITYRGQDYFVHFHLYAKDNWGEGPEIYSSVTKRGMSFSHNDAAPTYRAAIREAVIEAVREYTCTNPEILVAAERAHVNNELLDAEKEEEKAAIALKTAKAKVRELRKREAKLAS